MRIHKWIKADNWINLNTQLNFYYFSRLNINASLVRRGESMTDIWLINTTNPLYIIFLTNRKKSPGRAGNCLTQSYKDFRCLFSPRQSNPPIKSRFLFLKTILETFVFKLVLQLFPYLPPSILDIESWATQKGFSNTPPTILAFRFLPLL